MQPTNLTDAGKTENGGPIIYVVSAVIPGGDLALRDRYVRWLVEDHIGKLRAAGALRAEVRQRIAVDAVPGAAAELLVEGHYTFTDVAALERYLAESAQALRVEGLVAFPVQLGLLFERRVTRVVVSA